MDWRAINYDWNHLKAFWVTAQEGSLSAAARALGVAQPTLGRQVAALEKQLGVVLFERHGRGLELTPTGQQLLAPLKHMSDAAAELSLLAAGQSGEVKGRVCISVTDSIAEFMLPPVIQQLREHHPGIVVEILATNDLSDLRRREADIALRAVEPEQGDLIARKLRSFKAYLYATEDYLATVTTGRSLRELNKAAFVGFAENKILIDEFAAQGLTINEDNFSAISESHSVHWQLVKAGLGIGIMIEDIGDADSSVIRACDDFKPYQGGLWLVAHRELRTSRRVKAVFDFLLAHFGENE
ncbi:transcriptional regulator, LysR family [Alteromonadaceae bacterium Bs31]|nr:transcriptional regulator, LysR family [Alteromonadaceae bacterium Bs31]